MLQKGFVLLQAKKFDAALQTYQEAQAVEPLNEIPPFILGYCYAGKGLKSQAVDYYNKSIAIVSPDSPIPQAMIYLAAAYAGMPEKRGKARELLVRIESAKTYVSPALRAVVYAELGENDTAMKLLEEAYIRRDLLLKYIKTGYEYDKLRTDPRFTDLLKRTGLEG